jgi:hypothetical protein
MAKTCHEHKPLPPDVHDLPYEQRKHAILYSSTIPSVVNLGQWMRGVLKQTMQQNFMAISQFELQQLVRQLDKHPHQVVHLNLNHNSISHGDAPKALCRSLAALTGLQMLDLSSIALRNCVAKTSLRVICLNRVAGNQFYDVADILGESLAALTE